MNTRTRSNLLAVLVAAIVVATVVATSAFLAWSSDVAGAYDDGPDSGPDIGTPEWCDSIDYPSNYCLDPDGGIVGPCDPYDVDCPTTTVPAPTTTVPAPTSTVPAPTTTVEVPTELIPSLTLERAPVYVAPPSTVAPPADAPRPIAFTG